MRSTSNNQNNEKSDELDLSDTTPVILLIIHEVSYFLRHKAKNATAVIIKFGPWLLA